MPLSNNEEYTRPIVPGDPNFEECTPLARFDKLTDVPLDLIANAGVEHILVDFDGTMIPYGASELTINQEVKAWLEQASVDPRFKSLNLATARGGFDEIDDLDRWGVKLNAIYQPWTAGRLGYISKEHPVFWRKILFEKDCVETPEKIGNIGDSPFHDINPAQKAGLQAVLVNRRQYRLPGFPVRPNMKG